MKSKKTKKALTGSVLALVLCFVMLLGTTFAWFTDTASTKVNSIQSGKLDVALEMKDADGKWVSAEGKTLTFKTKDGREADKILWEPGATYELPELRIVNNGNLALKYKVEISGINGDDKLNEAIDWYYSIELSSVIPGATGWTTPSDAYKLEAFGDENYLYPEGVAQNARTHEQVFKIIGKMKENAGNEYQDLKIDSVAITVYATQYNYEYDSATKDYDKDATYANVVELKHQSDYVADNTKKLGYSVSGKDLVFEDQVFMIDDLTSLNDGCYYLGYAFAYSDTDGTKRESITFRNCTFIDATGSAKLVWANEFSNVAITVENCTFTGFKMAFQLGKKNDTNTSTLTVKNCQISGDRGISLSEWTTAAAFDGNTFNLSTDADDYFLNVAQTVSGGTISITNNTVTSVGTVAKLHGAVEAADASSWSGLSVSGNTYPAGATMFKNSGSLDDSSDAVTSLKTALGISE